MFLPVEPGPSHDPRYSRPAASGAEAWLSVSILLGVVLLLIGLAISVNLIAGVVIASAAFIILAWLLRSTAAFLARRPLWLLPLAAICGLAAGGIAGADAMSDRVDAAGSATSASHSVGARLNTWWTRVEHDLSRVGSHRGSDYRRYRSPVLPDIRWDSPIKLPTFRSDLNGASWRGSLPSYRQPSYNPPLRIPPVYNPPVRINPPAINPPRVPTYNAPPVRVPNPPAYRPPIFNPPMPRIPTMPMFPR
jgi:hypothetical protein